MRLDELNRAALTDEAASDFVTLIGRVSETLDVDVQGRIRISDALLAHIGVQRDVVIVGAVNRLQVWAAGNEPSLDEAFGRLTATARTINF
jgi:MraZ protein